MHWWYQCKEGVERGVKGQSLDKGSHTHTSSKWQMPQQPAERAADGSEEGEVSTESKKRVSRRRAGGLLHKT